MDFEPIDEVLGDTIAKGDIVCFAGDYHQITGEGMDDLTQVAYPSYNLSTGDEAEVIFSFDGPVVIFRSF